MVDFHVHGVVVLLFTLSKVLCTELNLAIPESGTVIEEFASDSLQLSFFCRLLNTQGSQIVTNWFFLSEEGKAEGRGPGGLTSSDTRFNQSGDTIMAGQFQIPSNTNLTVNALATDLHNSTLSCGTADDNFIAVFTIFAYVNPSIPGNLDVILEDLSATITWETPVNLGNPKISYYTLIILDDQGNTHVNETLPAPVTTMFTMPGLLPLTNYTVTLTAVSQLAPTPVISPTASFNFSTTTTVPLVNCRTASIATDQRSLRIEWDNIHTGGLDLISATIEYAVLTSSENATGSNSTPVDNPVVDINGGAAVLRTLPEAGLDYVFTVSTENAEGESNPSQCPPVFLAIGAPSTPDKPIARANGPVAILTLQTAKSGTGNSALPFAFSVLVYRFNETSNTSQLVSEEERFNSSEYTSNESIKIHIQDVMELNQLYRFAARAVNAFGMSEISALSDAILLNVSQPTISRVDTQQTPDGIAVSWAFLHTGGSELQLVEIFLREDRDGATLELVPGGNLSRPLSTSFMIDGSNLQAGVSYEIAVRATNDLGVSEAIVSEIQESGIGVPAVPLIPTLSSSTSTSITLILSTSANGLIRPGDTLTFRLRVTTTDANGNSETSYETGEFSAEMSRSSVRLTVPAETGVSYVFSVRAENRFGPSEYSGDSESITIPEPTEGEGTDELEMREVIGIAVGVGIVVLLLLFCCVLLVCALLTRGGKESHKMEEEAGLEMQDNSLYKQNQKPVENRKEFPPEAFESQYEAPPDDGHTVPLRPKPTHPTGAPTEGALPLYDSLNPAGRHVSTYSSTSSRELPNPLYSGARPTSQHDSGSGVIHSKTVRGGTGGGGGGEEPLYSEAGVPPETNGGIYTEPDSRGSKLLDPFSAPPPPPPDPRTIPTASPPLKTAPLVDGSDDPKELPTYAEAGPAGSEEHLYSELPDPHRHPDTSSPSHPSHFHIPPPPPTQPPPSTPLPSDSTEEPSYSVPSRAGSQNRTGI